MFGDERITTVVIGMGGHFPAIPTNPYQGCDKIYARAPVYHWKIAVLTSQMNKFDSCQEYPTTMLKQDCGDVRVGTSVVCSQTLNGSIPLRTLEINTLKAYTIYALIG